MEQDSQFRHLAKSKILHTRTPAVEGRNWLGLSAMTCISCVTKRTLVG